MTLHGDLLNGVSYALFIPVYLSKATVDPTPGAYCVNFFLCATFLLNWGSYLKGKHALSMLASVCMTGCMSTMGIYQWPYHGQSTLIPQYLWALFVVSGNVDLSFAYKMFTTAHTTVMAILVALYMPDNVVDSREALLMIVSAAFIHVSVHYQAKTQPNDSKKDLLSAKMACLILATAHAYHLALEIIKMAQIPGYAAQEGGYNIMKMGFLAMLGMAATGAFKEQVDMKEQLEGLVKERTAEIERQSVKLKLVSLAMEASETKIAIVNQKQEVIWSNPALQELIGEGKSDDLFSKFMLSKAEVDKLQKYFAQSDQKTLEIELQNMDLIISITNFDDKSLVAFSDVSQRRARERAEKSAEREKIQKRAMNDAMETLSHELRTPLQSIIGMTSLLMDSTDSQELRESLSTVVGSSRWLLTLINNLLDVRKVDAKMMNEFELSSIPLHRLVSETAQFCRPIAGISDLDLDVKIEPGHDSTCVMTNSIRFQQILVNLVTNAIKHTPGGSVSIQTEVLPVEKVRSRLNRSFAVGLAGRYPPKKDSRVAVRDSGKGLPRDMQDRVFGKFSQFGSHEEGRGDVAQPTGTGLGLNLCLKFVDKMAGNIWVTNEEHGACFSFYLPVVEPNTAFCQRKTKTTDVLTRGPQPSGLSSMEPYRVLLVDDVMVNIKVLTRMLKFIPDVGSIKTALSGKEALEVLQEDSFDLVITDLRMPGMSGIELCDAIRKSSLRKMPIVVGLTADTCESLHQRCSAVGMWHILHKPMCNVHLKVFFESTLSGLTPCDRYLSSSNVEAQ